MEGREESVGRVGSLRRHLRQNAVAYVALYFALAGSAVALQGRNSVDSGDIINKQVKSRDLAKNAAKSGKIAPDAISGASVLDGSLGGADIDEASLELAGFDSVEAEEEVSAPNSTETLSGPSLDVEVPPNGRVEALASVEVDSMGGATAARVDLRLGFQSGLASTRIIYTPESSTFCTIPGSHDGLDGFGCAPVSIPRENTSEQTQTWNVSLRYRGVGGTPTFADRKLWARVIAPPEAG